MKHSTEASEMLVNVTGANNNICRTYLHYKYMKHRPSWPRMCESKREKKLGAHVKLSESFITSWGREQKVKCWGHVYTLELCASFITSCMWDQLQENIFYILFSSNDNTCLTSEGNSSHSIHRAPVNATLWRIRIWFPELSWFVKNGCISS